MSRRKKGQGQQRREWQPLRQGDPNPTLVEAAIRSGELPRGAEYQAWGNDLYDAAAIVYPDIGAIPESLRGCIYITLKRRDRHAIHDWRHFQQIKNEIAGPEREAVELYPAEARLVDEANQYHLFVLPPGMRVPFGSSSRMVSSDEQLQEFNRQRERGEHRGRQRPWQPGLTTGRDDKDGEK